MIEILPAIIPEDLDDLMSHLVRIRGVLPRVQVDIVDGIVVPARTWPYTDWRSFEPMLKGEEGLPLWEEFEYEVHLMIRNAELHVDDWINAGVSSVVFHPLFSENPKKVIEKCKEQDVSVGVAFTPSEDWQVMFENYPEADFFQVMGNDQIGYHGVELDPRIYAIVESMRKVYKGTIAVDIGVDEDTAPQLIKVGVNKLISGSMVFNAENLEDLLEGIEGYEGRNEE